MTTCLKNLLANAIASYGWLGSICFLVQGLNFDRIEALVELLVEALVGLPHDQLLAMMPQAMRSAPRLLPIVGKTLNTADDGIDVKTVAALKAIISGTV